MLSRWEAQKESGNVKFEEFSGDSELAETGWRENRWGTGEEGSQPAQQIVLGSCNDAVSAGGGGVGTRMSLAPGKAIPLSPSSKHINITRWAKNFIHFGSGGIAFHPGRPSSFWDIVICYKLSSPRDNLTTNRANHLTLNCARWWRVIRRKAVGDFILWSAREFALKGGNN